LPRAATRLLVVGGPGESTGVNEPAVRMNTAPRRRSHALQRAASRQDRCFVRHDRLQVEGADLLLRIGPLYSRLGVAASRHRIDVNPDLAGQDWNKGSAPAGFRTEGVQWETTRTKALRAAGHASRGSRLQPARWLTKNDQDAQDVVQEA
jgi:hypothetical protein